MRDIPGYEGLYAITSCGRVWSYTTKKFLKPGTNRWGYKIVVLSKNGKTKTYKIHRLVAEAFIPNPENKPCINHIDENKSNNALLNLEWATYQENNNYGTRNERAAKSRQKKVICVETGIIYNSVKEAAKAVGAFQSNISSCLAGRYKTSGGFHWRYYKDEK